MSRHQNGGILITNVQFKVCSCWFSMWYVWWGLFNLAYVIWGFHKTSNYFSNIFFSIKVWRGSLRLLLSPIFRYLKAYILMHHRLDLYLVMLRAMEAARSLHNPRLDHTHCPHSWAGTWRNQPCQPGESPGRTHRWHRRRSRHPSPLESYYSLF